MAIAYSAAAVLGASILTAFAVPKGPNQEVIKASVILTMICCWLFWAVAYMAQLNPIIKPLYK